MSSYKRVSGNFTIQTVSANDVVTLDSSTTTLTGSANIGTFLQLTPQGSAPSSPAAGMVYYDSNTNTLKCYNGSGWLTITMS